MTITPEQFTDLISAINSIARAINNLGQGLVFISILFLLFKKMG